jgi:hypothetical protein
MSDKFKHAIQNMRDILHFQEIEKLTELEFSELVASHDSPAAKQIEQLKRELAEVTKQRDALAEALRTASERFRNPKFGCIWDDAADDIDKTLSSVKGGSDE